MPWVFFDFCLKREFKKTSDPPPPPQKNRGRPAVFTVLVPDSNETFPIDIRTSYNIHFNYWNQHRNIVQSAEIQIHHKMLVCTVTDNWNFSGALQYLPNFQVLPFGPKENQWFFIYQAVPFVVNHCYVMQFPDQHVQEKCLSCKVTQSHFKPKAIMWSIIDLRNSYPFVWIHVSISKTTSIKISTDLQISPSNLGIKTSARIFLKKKKFRK